MDLYRLQKYEIYFSVLCIYLCIEDIFFFFCDDDYFIIIISRRRS